MKPSGFLFLTILALGSTLVWCSRGELVLVYMSAFIAVLLSGAYALEATGQDFEEEKNKVELHTLQTARAMSDKAIRERIDELQETLDESR